MVYFYFDFWDTEHRETMCGLLSCLVFQLAAESDSCYQILFLYSDHAGGTRELSEDVISQCLVEMLQVPGQSAMYTIVDVLDECTNIGCRPHPDRCSSFWGMSSSSKSQMYTNVALVGQKLTFKTLLNPWSYFVCSTTTRADKGHIYRPCRPL